MRIHTEVQEKVIITLNIIAILFGYFFIFSYLNYDIATDHDHFYPLEKVVNGTMFSSGRWISAIFSFFYFIALPKITNLHINDITTTLVPFINASTISISTIIFLKLFYFYSKEKKNIVTRPSFCILYPLTFIAIAILPMMNHGLDVFNFSSLHSVVRHYDHYFCFVFYAIFCYSLFSLLHFQTKKHLILYSINAFILGISTESLPITACISTIILMLLLIVQKIRNRIQTTNKTIIYIAIIFAFLLLGATLQFLNSSYAEGENPSYHFDMFGQLIAIKQNIIPFIKSFIKIMLIDNSPILSLLIAANIAIMFSKENKSKIYLFQIAIFSGFLVEALSFVFLNNASIIYPINYWFEYYPFRAMYWKSLLLLLFITSGYIINVIDNKKLKIITILILFSFLIFCLCSNFNLIKEQYNIQTKGIKELRTTIYMADKIALTYHTLDGIAILPISFYEKYSQYTSIFRPRACDSKEKIRKIMLETSELEIEENESRVFSWFNKSEHQADNDYLYYLKLAYGIYLDGIKFVEDDIAYSEFAKRGGSFSYEELSQLHFSKLKTFLEKQQTTKKEIEKNGNLPYLYASQCRLDIKNGEYKNAIENCTLAIDIGKEQKEEFYHLYYSFLGDAYFLIGDKNQTIKSYEKLLSKEFYYLEKMKKLAYIYEENKDYEDAIDIYEKIIDLHPFVPDLEDEGTYYNQIAVLYYQNKEFKEAMKYIKVAEKYSKESINYLLKGFIQLELGQNQQGIKTLEFWLNTHPHINSIQRKKIREIIKKAKNKK